MAKAKRKKKPEPITIIGPTDEQASKGTFQRLTMAYRRIPVIDTMVQSGKLTARQFNGLARYRDVAIADERSEIEDSVGKMMRGAVGGGEGGYSPSMVRNAIELGRLEQALGPLRDIARAVAVNDTTVSQWAIEKWGSIEGRSVKGKTVTTFLAPKPGAQEQALAEVRAAGDALATAIGG